MGLNKIVFPEEMLLLANPHCVAARLRGAHHRDARVLVRLERVRRIDYEQDPQDAITSLRRASALPWAGLSGFGPAGWPCRRWRGRARRRSGRRRRPLGGTRPCPLWGRGAGLACL